MRPNDLPRTRGDKPAVAAKPLALTAIYPAHAGINLRMMCMTA